MTFEQTLKDWREARKTGDKVTMTRCREELRKTFCPADVVELIGREVDENGED